VSSKAEEMVWRLRRKYREIPFERFEKIVFVIGKEAIFGGGSDEDIAVLEMLLEEEAKKARDQKEAERGEMEQQIERITASMLHRTLLLSLPGGIDHEHARAILVYGFLAPSSSRRFIGGKFLPPEHVLEDVANKLGVLFNPVEYRKALNFLIHQGVVVERPKRGTVYSLNLYPSASSVTQWGKEIICACKRFLHAHHPSK